jgi:exonuclease SbcD
MKVLHTADWHLGKKLDHFSRFEEQQRVMNEIVILLIARMRM